MPIKKAKIFLGIDPGYAITGYGIIKIQGDKISTLDYGIIQTPAKQEFIQRLEKINTELNKIIKKHKPEVAGCEKLFFAKNTKTAIDVGQARGVILLTIRQNKLQVAEFTPLEIKQCVAGYGQADKKQIQTMVKTLLNLKTIPQPDDAADALAVALTCAQCINSPLYEKK